MPTNLYALIEQRPEHPNFGQPFYVGIGGIKRPKTHIAEARSSKGHWNARVDAVMQAHFVLGLEPMIAILSTHADRIDAALAEREIIGRLGRSGIEEGGTLCNLAGGGDGPDPAALAVPEVRAKLRASLKAAWEDPEMRERRLARLAITNAEMTREQRREAAHKKSDDGKQRSTDAIIAASKDPDLMAKRIEAMREPARKSWADPDIRARRTEAMTGTPKTMTPEAIAARQANARAPKSKDTIAALSAAADRKWATPGFREKRRANQAAAWEDPEKRANMLAGRSEGIAKSWADPEVREKRIAAIKARAAEKAAAKGPAEPKVKRTRSEAMSALNASMTTEDRSALQANSWADPEVAAARKAGIKAAAQNPELKAARVAAMLAGKRRKAALKAQGLLDGAH